VIVVDASAVVVALADDGLPGRKVRRRIEGQPLVAPHLIDAEVVSVWRRLVAAGDLSTERAELGLAALSDLPMTRVPHSKLLARCWELRSNVTTYDALYVALAEFLDVPLMTSDDRLVRSPGSRCAFIRLQDL